MRGERSWVGQFGDLSTHLENWNLIEAHHLVLIVDHYFWYPGTRSARCSLLLLICQSVVFTLRLQDVIIRVFVVADEDVDVYPVVHVVVRGVAPAVLHIQEHLLLRRAVIVSASVVRELHLVALRCDDDHSPILLLLCQRCVLILRHHGSFVRVPVLLPGQEVRMLSPLLLLLVVSNLHLG